MKQLFSLSSTVCSLRKREEGETLISHFRNDASDFERMWVSQCERAEELFFFIIWWFNAKATACYTLTLPMHEGNTITICNGQDWTQIQHKSIPNLGHFKCLIIQLIEFKQTTIHMPGRRTQSLQREKQGRQQTDRQPAGTHSDGSLGYWGRMTDRTGGEGGAFLEMPREHFLLS